MRKTLEVDKRINIYGGRKDIEKAEKVLNTLKATLSELNESEARLVIQDLIDVEKLNAGISFDGNTIWGKNKILRNLKRIIKEGVLGHAGYIPIGSLLRMPSYSRGKPVLSNYFYEFLHLSCGSIAYYNKAGWIAEYSTVEDFKSFFLKNEFGRRVLNHIPGWKTDAIRIVKEIESMLEI